MGTKQEYLKTETARGRNENKMTRELIQIDEQ